MTPIVIRLHCYDCARGKIAIQDVMREKDYLQQVLERHAHATETVLSPGALRGKWAIPRLPYRSVHKRRFKSCLEDIMTGQYDQEWLATSMDRRRILPKKNGDLTC